MDRRIKPWINKKIVEYIGEEEPTLTEFICSKLLLHSNAESILNDITMVGNMIEYYYDARIIKFYVPGVDMYTILLNEYYSNKSV